MRLDKLIANMGIGSRKDVKKLVSKNQVMVNGVIVRNADINVDENKDIIEVSGKTVTYKQYVYLMMNKPAGVLSATSDGAGETVIDLVGDDYSFYDLSPAGRLDKDSEGFMILSNDGDFIHNIISPNKHVDKIYYIETDGEFTESDTEKFKSRITLGDGYECLEAELKVIETKNGKSKALVTVHEGKYHQVKRMAKACGKTVTYLKRLSIGGVYLDDSLEKGKYRELTEEELKLLKE